MPEATGRPNGVTPGGDQGSRGRSGPHGGNQLEVGRSIWSVTLVTRRAILLENVRPPLQLAQEMDSCRPSNRLGARGGRGGQRDADGQEQAVNALWRDDHWNT